MNRNKDLHRIKFGRGRFFLTSAASILVSMQLASCSAKPPELSSNVTPTIPEGIVDLSAIADIDWYLLTSKNEATLKEGKIIPYDRKAGAGHITEVRSRLPGKKQLAFTGLVTYQWSDGEKMQNLPPISPALSMQFEAAGESSGFDAFINLPRDDLYVVVHGGCAGVSASIEANVSEVVETQALRCRGEDIYETQYWTYQLRVEHAAGETLELRINSIDAESGLPALTVSGLLLATQPVAP